MVRYGPKGWATGEKKMGKRGMCHCNLLLHNPPAFVVGFKTEKHQNDDASLVLPCTRTNPNR